MSLQEKWFQLEQKVEMEGDISKKVVYMGNFIFARSWVPQDRVEGSMDLAMSGRWG